MLVKKITCFFVLRSETCNQKNIFFRPLKCTLFDNKKDVTALYRR